jgi:hypothetical protein
MNGLAALILILYILGILYSANIYYNNHKNRLFALSSGLILSILIIVFSGKSIKNANDIKENPDASVPALLFTSAGASLGVGVFFLIVGILVSCLSIAGFIFM